ncbi:MAG: YbgC/FadM family acyl-CoA thioesterase [Desulfobacterales bacterium]|nr:YbgC/FadM family acyl-CoA thioesterase [Desulfobacterales bacterium]
MPLKTYHLPVQVYYEDTDHSGVVYHANYLKYFERAREGVIGPAALVALWKEQGLGFAVYKADVNFLDGAEFGDTLDIVSTVRKDSDYRLVWQQEAWRPGAAKAAVRAEIHLVCVDREKNLKPIPDVGIDFDR